MYDLKLAQTMKRIVAIWKPIHVFLVCMQMIAFQRTILPETLLNYILQKWQESRLELKSHTKFIDGMSLTNSISRFCNNSYLFKKFVIMAIL